MQPSTAPTFPVPTPSWATLKLVKGEPALFCVADVYGGNPNKGDISLGRTCPRGSRCVAGENPCEGWISFDNVGTAAFTIFQSLQLEGFFATTYALQDAHSSASWAYMIAVMLLLTYTVMNTFCAVIYQSLVHLRVEAAREAKSLEEQDETFHENVSLATNALFRPEESLEMKRIQSVGVEPEVPESQAQGSRREDEALSPKSAAGKGGIALGQRFKRDKGAVEASNAAGWQVKQRVEWRSPEGFTRGYIARCLSGQTTNEWYRDINRHRRHGTGAWWTCLPDEVLYVHVWS